MANLKALKRQVELTQKKRAEKPKPKPKPKPAKPVEKVVAESNSKITAALTAGFKTLGDLLQTLVNRPEPAQVDPETIKQAVAEGISSVKPQKITFPAHKPVSYQATIQRRGKEMIGARIDPIEEGGN